MNKLKQPQGAHSKIRAIKQYGGKAYGKQEAERCSGAFS